MEETKDSINSSIFELLSDIKTFEKEIDEDLEKGNEEEYEQEQ